MSMSKALSFEDLVPSAPKGRFAGIRRPYSPEDVVRLRGSFPISYTLAERGANKLWQLLHERPYVHALGAVTGNQAMQMVRGGLEAIYLSGWQVAADANVAGAMYPDQSLYPANSGPGLARLVRSDRGRRRGRIWRPAKCVRDHESLYRGRRGGGPLRGSARFRKKVRPSRRQGVDPNFAARAKPRRGPPRGGCHGSSDSRRCPHGC